MKRSYRFSMGLLSLALIVLFVAVFPTVTWSYSSPMTQLQHVWQRANNIGVYSYQTEIAQTAHPLPNLANVGLGSTDSRMYIQGSVNLPDEHIHMAFWDSEGFTPPGSSTDTNGVLHHASDTTPSNTWTAPSNSLQFRIDHDKAYTLNAVGDWQEVKDQDLTGVFAPGQDIMGYLAAAKNVQPATSEEHNGTSFMCYRFDIDGPALARSMKAKLQENLQRQNKLPPGATVDVTKLYAQWHGTGEVWVNDQGLPMRQIINIAFPHPYNQETVEATMQTEFSQWQRQQQAQWLRILMPPLNHIDRDDIQQGSLSFAFLALVVALMVAMVRHAHSRRLYMAIALSVIISMLATPLLQSHQVHVFAKELQTQQHTSMYEQHTNQAIQQIEADMMRPSNPHTDPFLAIRLQNEVGTYQNAPAYDAQTTSTQAPDSDDDGLTDSDERARGTNPYKTDSDGDGLTDWQEVQIGINPLDVDTDGDGISDKTEGEGFISKGKRIFLNPLQADSNKDSFIDGIECLELLDITIDNNGRNKLDKSAKVSGKTCGDTDGDGTPDAFDQDDDNDGVPDRVDDARTVAMGSSVKNGAITGFANQTFEFNLSKASTQKITFVDFQIRPVNPDHLNYHSNVLDWPGNDRAGQIQRVKDTTFRQFNGDSQPSDSKDSNGDVRLLPMLEIEIPYKQGSAGGLPTKCNAEASACPAQPTSDNIQEWLDSWLDKAELDRYGISVQPKDEKGTLIAYVPVNIVRDSVGDSPVAFTARMVYRINTDFGLNQKARLIWLVQAITDQCTAIPDDFMEGEENDIRYDAWCKDTSHWQSSINTIHTYYDDWYLSGLTARQELGLTVGAISQPYTGQTYDSHLWTLAQGLERSFIAAGRNDLTVQEIKNRFDASSNARSNNTERWGIPRKALNVMVHTFQTQTDLIKFSTEYNKQILSDSSFQRANYASVLYVNSQTNRMVSLDSDAANIGARAQRGVIRSSRLAINIGPETELSGQSMKLVPFCKQDGAWDACESTDYSEHFASVAKTMLKNAYRNDSQTTIDGKTVFLQSFLIALTNGETETTLPAIDDKTIKATVNPNGQDPLIKLVEDFVPQNGLEKASFFQSLGSDNGESGQSSKARSAYNQRATKDTGLANTADVALNTFITINSQPSSIAPSTYTLPSPIKMAKNEVVIGKVAVYSGLSALKAYKVYQGAKAAAGTSKFVAKSSAEFSKLSKFGKVKASALSVVGLGVDLYFAIDGFVSQGLEPGTPAFKQALSFMLGQIIVALIMFAIDLIPGIGSLINSAILLIDSAIMGICKLAGAEGDTADFFCSGIQGMLARVLANSFYRYEPWVDLNREDRLDIGGLQHALVNAQRGFVVGNTLQISAKVSSTIFERKTTASEVATDVVLGIATGGISTLISEVSKPDPNVRTTTLKYQLTRVKEEDDNRIHKRLKLEPNQMESEWKYNNNTIKQDVILLLPLDKPGINVPDTGSAYYLAEGQAYKATETTASVHFEEKTAHDSLYISMGPGSVFDTLPADLDGFYQLTKRDTGYALAWDSKFPVLADADGDGLRSPAFGGNDPNDSRFDTDNDGLSDFYEIQHATLGLNPLNADSDNDTLSDYDELIYGTDPGKADSDYEGLMDGFELNGWNIVYGKDAQGKNLIAHITSDPFKRDTDNDTITDYREMVFGTNPRVWSDPEVVKIASEIDDTDGYVAPSQVINYTANIANKMLGRDVRGLLEVDFPPAVQDIRVQPKPFILGPQQQTTMQGSVQVKPDAVTQKLDFTNRASSFIPNDQSQATRVLNKTKDDFVMRFDEPPKSTTFVLGTKDKDMSFTCQEATCPDSGLPGVYNQAARFEEDDSLAGSLTTTGVSAFGIWIKPSSQSRQRATIVDFIDKANNNQSIYGLRYDGSQQQVYVQYNNDTRNYHPTTVPVGQWSFVSVVIQDAPKASDRALLIGVNGTTKSTLSGDYVYRGSYSPVLGATAKTHSFVGLMDHLIIRRNADYADIGMMRQAPVMTLHFDESVDSKTFANENQALLGDDVTCSNCPASGIKGQIRNAVQFDSSDDRLTLPYQLEHYLNQGFIGVSMWVKPTAPTGSNQTLLTNLTPKTTFGGGGFKLYLDKNLQPVFYAIVAYTGEDGTCWMTAQTPSLKSPAPLVLNEWNHIVATHHLDQGMTLYVNGYKVASGKLRDRFNTVKDQQPFICPSDKEATLGSIVGSIDEVSIFSEELLSGFGWFEQSEIADVIPTASEVAATFNYQGAWYDATASHQVVIDADKPTVKLDLSATHLAKRDIVLPIVAQDATSGLEKVEYQINNGQWVNPTLDEGVWTFTYQPTTSGKQTITVRATDRVGNSSSQNTSFIIDSIGPSVSLDGANVNEPQPIKAHSATDTWTMKLSGKVTENGTNDSGVQSVTVTVFDKHGGYIGKPQTTQTFAQDGTWSVDYSLGLKPDGFYPVQVDAIDTVGNQTSETYTIALETTAPTADISTNSNYSDDEGQLVANILVGTGDNRPTIQGSISDAGVFPNPLLTLHLDESAGATRFQDSSTTLLHATCSNSGNDTCPQAGTPGKYGNALTFDGNDFVTFSEGATYRQTDALLEQNPEAYPKSAPLPRQAFSVAAWVLVDQPRSIDGFVSAIQVIGGAEKGWMLGSRNGRFVFALASTGADDGDGFMTYLEDPEQYTTGQWYHVVGTYNGTTMRIYVNGDLKAATDVQAGDILYPDSAWFGLGAYRDGDEDYRLNGQIDEVALYERTLSSDDIQGQFIAASGIATLELGMLHAKDDADTPTQWFTIPLQLTEERQNYAAWSYQIPEGFEGPYALWLRTTDKAGNMREIPDVWQGMIDTRVPQIALKPQDANGKVQYTTTAQDFNLSKENFTSPCGMGIIETSENNTEPWYQNTFASVDKDGTPVPAPDKLYRMTAQCEIAGSLNYQDVAVLQGKQVSIAGTYAYVVHENGNDYSIFDIANPAKPNLLYELKNGWFPIASLTPSSDNTSFSYAFPYGFIHNNVADFIAKKYTSSVRIPSNNNLKGVYTSSGSQYAYIMEDLYIPPITAETLKTMTAEEFAKQARQGKVSIFDYEDNALRKGTYEDLSPRFVGTYGNYLLITGNHYGETKLKVLDIANPDEPFKEVAIYDNPLGNGSVVAGQYLYTVNNNGLRIFDLSQIRKRPIPVRTCETYGWQSFCDYDRSYPTLSAMASYAATGYTNDVAVVDNTAYLAGNDGIETVDITNKQDIKRIARYTPPKNHVVDQVQVQGKTIVAQVRHRFGSTSPTIRLIRLSNAPTATACDSFGNCTTQTASRLTTRAPTVAAPDAEEYDMPVSTREAETPQSIEIEVGTVPDMLNEARPMVFTVAFQSEAGLQEVSASIGSDTLISHTWASSDVITDISATMPPWVPLTDGKHTLVVQATDHNGATVRDESTTIIVDTQAPTLMFNKQTETLNSQDYHAGIFVLDGTVNDGVGLADIDATIETEQGVEDIPITFTDANGNTLNTPINFIDGTPDMQAVQWQAPFTFNRAKPARLTATFTFTATDLVGHQTVVQKPFVIDAMAPTQGDMTLGYKANADTEETTVITAGMTLANVPDPELVINWQPASDPSTINRYLVGWTTSPTPTLSALTSYGVGDSTHTQAVSDGQKWYAHVIAEDGAGNQTSATLGPIYVDYATTPSYISMQENGIYPYRSWSDSACSLVGVDNRINERASTVGSLRDSQKFYTTWNDDGLRMMWSGANWDADGDLFIYLDSKDGGSSQLYNPYPATITNTAILLPPRNDASSLAAMQSQSTVEAGLQATSPRPLARPRLSATSGPMAADALIWVQGSITATLMLWDGTAWQPSNGLHYFFDKDLPTPLTDLYVPFNAVDIANPDETTLSLVAVASEENALRLWATMPSRNNLNSNRIVDANNDSALQQFALTKNYTWQLTDGVCPGVAPDATTDATLQTNSIEGTPTGGDVRVALSSYPSGVAYSLLNDNLFFAMKDLPQFAGVDWSSITDQLCADNPDDPACQRTSVDKPALQGTTDSTRLASLAPANGGAYFSAQEQLDSTMSVRTTPIGDKNVVIYTLNLENKGTEPSHNIVADIYTWGPIRLPGGEKRTDSAGEYDVRTLQVGDLAPGKSTQVSFPAIVDATFDPQNQHGKATIDVTVYDSTGSHEHLDDGTDIYANELDWLYVDHEVDTSPPDYIEMLSPQGILAIGRNTINGFVYDRSPVPTIELEVQQPDKTSRILVCNDDTPDDNTWSCNVNVDALGAGESIAVRARATDTYGYTGEWSPWSDYIVDITPPQVHLDDMSHTTLMSGTLGYNQALIQGTMSDNYDVAGVEVCDAVEGVETCLPATILPNPEGEVQTIFAYDDAPLAPMEIGANTTCANPLIRTFVVTETFPVERLSVGLNITHTMRGDLSVMLQSPQGTEVALLYDGTNAENYDVLIDDASAILDRDDTVDHAITTAAPPYANQRGGYGLLSTFRGEQVEGTWKLTICDAYPESDNGTYNSSRLVFTAPTLPENTTVSWTYPLDIPEPVVAVQTVGLEQTQTDVVVDTTQSPASNDASFTTYLPLIVSGGDAANNHTSAAVPTPEPTAPAIPTPTTPLAAELAPLHTITIYGTDAMGNRTPNPLRYTYRIDNDPPSVQITSPPTITLTTSDIFTGSTKLHITGVVSDVSRITSMDITILRPDSVAVTAPVTVTQTAWEYMSTTMLDMAGTYQWWIETQDSAGNIGRVGPLAIIVEEDKEGEYK